MHTVESAERLGHCPQESSAERNFYDQKRYNNGDLRPIDGITPQPILGALNKKHADDYGKGYDPTSWVSTTFFVPEIAPVSDERTARRTAPEY